jgi:hypothetical protein
MECSAGLELHLGQYCLLVYCQVSQRSWTTDSIDLEWVGSTCHHEISSSYLFPSVANAIVRELFIIIDSSSYPSEFFSSFLIVYSLPWWLMKSCGGLRPAGISPSELAVLSRSTVCIRVTTKCDEILNLLFAYRRHSSSFFSSSFPFPLRLRRLIARHLRSSLSL